MPRLQPRSEALAKNAAQFWRVWSADHLRPKGGALQLMPDFARADARTQEPTEFLFLKEKGLECRRLSRRAKSGGAEPERGAEGGTRTPGLKIMSLALYP